MEAGVPQAERGRKAKAEEIEKGRVLLDYAKEFVVAEGGSCPTVQLGEPVSHKDGEEFGIDFTGTPLGVAGRARRQSP